MTILDTLAGIGITIMLVIVGYYLCISLKPYNEDTDIKKTKS